MTEIPRPPDRRPVRQPPPAAATTAGLAGSPPSDYPVTLTFDTPEKIARWRPLVHWLLAIPHFIVLYVIGIVAGVLAFIAWFAGVFTGRIPDGLQKPIAMYLRYNARVTTYALFQREEYPPFAFDGSFADPGDDPRRPGRRGAGDRGPQPADHLLPALHAHPADLRAVLRVDRGVRRDGHRLVRGDHPRPLADRDEQLPHRVPALEHAGERLLLPADRRVPAVQHGLS